MAQKPNTAVWAISRQRIGLKDSVPKALRSRPNGEKWPISGHAAVNERNSFDGPQTRRLACLEMTIA